MPVLRNNTKKSPQRARRRRGVRRTRHGSSVGAKILRTLLFVALAAVLLWIFLPENKEIPDSTPQEIEKAMAEAEKDVDAAMSLPDNFRREGAILQIRQREARLRNAGFTLAADSFAAATKRRLEYHGVIFND